MVFPIDARRITDWHSFHAVFAETFGFPDYYGRNMDAWIDCMSYIRDPDVCDTSIKVEPGEVVVLQLNDVTGFRRRCPEQFDALVECCDFVNKRQIEAGIGPLLVISHCE